MSIRFEEKKDFIIVFKGDDEAFRIEAAEGEATAKYYIEEFTKDLIGDALLLDLGEIPNSLKFSGDYVNPFFENMDYIDFRKSDGVALMELAITFTWLTWDKPIKINDFISNYELALKQHGYMTKIVDDGDDWVSINIFLNSNSGAPMDAVKQVAVDVKRVMDSVVLQIEKENLEDSFTRVFEFPKEYATICSQYLLWFGEFLSSLGIEADVTTDNKEELTAIVVTPRYSRELLVEIEHLFYKYLSLPYAELIPLKNPEKTTSFEVAQYQYLLAQVENFKLQLRMKESMMQMKDATIQSLNAQVTTLNTELLLLKSLKNECDVEMFGGAIKLGEFKWGSVKINPKKAIEEIKKKFK